MNGESSNRQHADANDQKHLCDLCGSRVVRIN